MSAFGPKQTVADGARLRSYRKQEAALNGWTADANGLRFRVERWPEGFYLFVFQGDETVPFRDELQDSLDLVKAGAAEDYQVPLDSWREESWPCSIR